MAATQRQSSEEKSVLPGLPEMQIELHNVISHSLDDFFID
jgi:hypothetical protein